MVVEGEEARFGPEEGDFDDGALFSCDFTEAGLADGGQFFPGTEAGPGHSSLLGGYSAAPGGRWQAACSLGRERRIG